MATEINKLVVPISDGQGSYTPTEITFEGSGGSSGHTIKDESGTSMTARSNLQFKGVKVTDDSTNNATIIDDRGTTIDWEDWNELTDEQKTTGKWDIINAPGADGTISIDLMTKLWENPDPTSNFAAQNIILSSDDYDMLLFIHKITTSSNYSKSDIIKKGQGLDIVFANATGTFIRYIAYTNDTTYAVDNSYATGSSSANNSRCIPVYVYGIKTSQTVHINAIAMDVNTAADHCMLSDDEHSVEDCLVASNDVPFRFAYDSTTQKYGYLIEDGGADTFVPFKDGSDPPTLIWTNPSPNSNFGAQTIQFDTSIYKSVVVKFKYKKSVSSPTGCVYADINNLPAVLGQDGNDGLYRRSGCSYTSSGFYFADAINPYGTAANQYMIPMYIYGYKNTI